MRIRRASVAAISVFILGSLVLPSWGWVRGGWGFRGGWGPRVYIGGPWWPYAYPYYDPYGPYYDPYPPDYYGAPTPAPSASINSESSGRNLKNVGEQLARMRDRLDFKYQDGDISQAQLDAGLRYLDAIEKLAHSEMDANGGTLTGGQENSLLGQVQQADPAIHGDPSAPYPPVTGYSAAPEVSPATQPESAYTPPIRNSTTVSDLLLELRTLLDQKLKDGAITKAQDAAEASYLKSIDDQVQTASRTNGGALSPEDEQQFIDQLHQAYYAINHDLIVH